MILSSPLTHRVMSNFTTQAFLLGVVYVMFALWRLIDILAKDLGGNTVAAEFMLFIKTRQVCAPTAVRTTCFIIKS